MTQHTSVTALALFSGGLDSILAARLIMEQGIPVHCLHFHAPFFGDPQAIPFWEKTYGLSITAVDLGETFVRLLRQGPEHGFGKVLNPCVDCKILMLRAARQLMETCHAAFIISGEVLGQRPMSQRRDTLNLIRKQAEAESWLLRPLSALHLEPTPMELVGLVDRERLQGISGRGRKDQLRLAEDFKLGEIPTPAGGCRLTEKENARRYWPVLQYRPQAGAADFHLANVGRQLWTRIGETHYWLSVGRHQADNARLLELAGSDDMLLKLADLPGPIALAREGTVWDAALLEDAAACMASFSPKAVDQAASGGTVEVCLRGGGQERRVAVVPNRTSRAGWAVCPWEDVREHVRAFNCALDAIKKGKTDSTQRTDHLAG